MPGIIGVSQGAISKVLRRVRSLTQGLREHRLKTITSIDDHVLFRIMGGTGVSQCQGSGWGWYQANWTLYRCRQGPKTFSSSWISLKTFWQMPQTNYWFSSMPLYVSTQASHWNHTHWSHLIFADGSRVSLENCNSHIWIFRRVVEELVDYCVKQNIDDQWSKVWPWPHQQTSHETSAPVDSVTQVAVIRSQSGASVQMTWAISSHN